MMMMMMMMIMMMMMMIMIQINSTVCVFILMIQSVYDFYWASYSAESTGLSGMGYNELVRQCLLTGPAIDQLGMKHLSRLGSTTTTAGGRRRRSSFPVGVLDVKAADTNEEKEKDSDKSEVGKIGVSVQHKLIDIAQGARKIVAMSPRLVF